MTKCAICEGENYVINKVKLTEHKAPIKLCVHCVSEVVGFIATRTEEWAFHNTKMKDR